MPLTFVPDAQRWHFSEEEEARLKECIVTCLTDGHDLKSTRDHYTVIRRVSDDANLTGTTKMPCEHESAFLIWESHIQNFMYGHETIRLVKSCWRKDDFSMIRRLGLLHESLAFVPDHDKWHLSEQVETEIKEDIRVICADERAPKGLREYYTYVRAIADDARLSGTSKMPWRLGPAFMLWESHFKNPLYGEELIQVMHDCWEKTDFSMLRRLGLLHGRPGSSGTALGGKPSPYETKNAPPSILKRKRLTNDCPPTQIETKCVRWHYPVCTC